MILFRTNTDGTVSQVKEKSFKLEREMQQLFERNLGTIMGLELVKSEFTIKNRRIDTLAFDPQTRAFVIIEYKRDRNMSVFDQGITYLNLLLQNKADFLVEYNERGGQQLRRTDVDWSQTRVVFVSTNFTENQIQATDFRDFSIELWKVQRYENGQIAVSPIQKSANAASVKLLGNDNATLKTVSDEIKTYTEENLLEDKSEDVVALYERFRTAILDLADGIEVKPQKWYVAFKQNGRNIVSVEVQKKGLKLYINAKQGSLDDPKHIARDVSDTGHLSTGDYAIDKIMDDSNLEYIMSIVKGVLKQS